MGVFALVGELLFYFGQVMFGLVDEKFEHGFANSLRVTTQLLHPEQGRLHLLDQMQDALECLGILDH